MRPARAARSWRLARIGALVAVAAVILIPSVVEAQRGRTGRLVLSGDQPGAEVYVDAELIGEMPIDPLELPVGEHALRVTRPGYTELTEVFRIRPRRETRVQVDLLPISMALRVVTDPAGAQVFVDGRFAGESPTDLDLLDGEHSIRVTLPLYVEVVRSVTAVAGQNETMELELEELPEDQMRALVGPPPETEWYEEPLTWVLIGGGAVAVALGVLLIVVLTADEPSQRDMFCAESPLGCSEWDPMLTPP